MRLTIFLLLLLSCHLQMSLVASQGFLLMAQAVVRHGDKVPDAIDPLTADEWDQFGISGQLTQLGIAQMGNLGKELHRLYVENEPLLPEVFDQNQIYARATSLGTFRTLVSAEAMLEGIYPGAPVPVYTVSGERETLLRPDQNCPSYVVEYPRIRETISEEFEENYSGLLNGIRTVTGFEGTPFDLIWNTREKIEAEEHHGFEIHPFLEQNAELIDELGEYAAEELYSMRGPSDPRGPIGGELARTLVENIENARSGASEVKFHLYSAHGGTLQVLWQQLGLGSIPEVIGAALVLELRLDAGQYIINAVWHELGSDGMTYTNRPQPLNCPSSSPRCAVDDFSAYVIDRNPEAGCCYVDERGGFFDVGCDDFLNPDTADIHECRLYRNWCPSVSCGPGQVVDRATLHCVQVNAKTKN